AECSLPAGISPVTLDSVNWQSGVTVDVTGVADGVVDGNQICIVVTGMAVSTAPGFSGDPADVTVTVIDIDTGPPGTISVTPTTLTITEGGSGSFTIQLDSAPTAPVTIPLGLTGDTACSLGGVTQVVFTPTGSTSTSVTV